MLYKQTAEEVTAVINAVTQWLNDRGYEIAATKTNQTLVEAFMYDHYRSSTGHVDWSESNLQQCISMLKKQGALTFSKQPQKTFDKPKSAFEQTALDSQLREARRQLQHETNERDLEYLRQAAHAISTFSAGRNHARTKDGKEMLTAVFDAEQKKLLAGKQTAAGLLAAVKATKDRL